MRRFAKHWRDSASLIIVARNEGNVADAESFNYKVLVFKRTEKTSFLPNHTVFPGGVFDPQDESPRWLSLLAQQGITEAAVQSVCTVSGPRPYIFQTTPSDTLDRNVSLRLCALRECFEELGVLLVTDRNVPTRTNSPSIGFSHAKEGFDVTTWQVDIHDGHKPLIELYAALDATPDLWGLYEWSTWITPTQFRKKRFETAFFLAALNTLPPVFPEHHEVQEYMVQQTWESPHSLLKAHAEGTLWLAPPQMYELQRLSYVHDIDALVQFAKKRKYHGTTPFCPVGYNVADGYISVLPGDDMYPSDYDYLSDNADQDRYVHLSAQELADRTRNIHRAVHHGLNSQTYVQNGPPVDGHLHVCGRNGVLLKL